MEIEPEDLLKKEVENQEEQDLIMKSEILLPQEKLPNPISQPVPVPQPLKWKELLEKIVASDYSIESITWKKDESGNMNGIVSFAVPLKTLGLTAYECKCTYNRELFSDFIMGFIGELYLRNNLEKFVERVLGMNYKEYVDTVSSKNHEFFGAVFNEKKGVFELSFFASLIQRIITEDFKLYVVYEKNQ